MKKLASFFAASGAISMTTAFARKRMEASMPGETGALAALRLTGIGL
jgi:hypothetical protein